MRRSLALILLAALALSSASVMAGCARNPRQTQVIEAKDSPEDNVGLTPLQRGKVRRDALRTATAGMDAWIRNDLSAMESRMSTEYADFYKKAAKEYAAEGRVRVRKHDDVKIDVVEMDDMGVEVIVQYKFKDLSYFKSKSGSATKPTGENTEFQITLKKDEKGDWKILRIIGGINELK